MAIQNNDVSLVSLLNILITSGQIISIIFYLSREIIRTGQFISSLSFFKKNIKRLQSLGKELIASKTELYFQKGVPLFYKRQFKTFNIQGLSVFKRTSCICSFFYRLCKILYILYQRFDENVVEWFDINRE